MWAALLALPGLIGQLAKGWLEYKQKAIELNREITLETLKAQSSQALAEAQSETTITHDRLAATSRKFKQGTYYLISSIVIFSVLFPGHAEVMWANFERIPEWFQWLWVTIHAAIWGLPAISRKTDSILDMLRTRRESKQEYKLEKIKALNEAKIFESLRKSIFTKGLTAKQVEAVQEAIKQGQE